MPALKKSFIPGSAGNLEGLVYLPDAAPRAIAVVAHPLPTMGGTMENKVVTTLAKTFAELGFVALCFNFRGVGGSEGEFDEGDGEVEDVLAVVHYARHACPDGTTSHSTSLSNNASQVAGYELSRRGDLPLVLSGFSFGGYVQARAAQQLHPQRLVLVAPAVGRFAMPHVPHDTLLIHGEQDEVVPLEDVLHWARPQHLPIVVLPGAEHFFHGRLNQIRQIVLHEFKGSPL